MSTHKLYIKDARVWIPHPQSVWQGGQLCADFRSGDTECIVLTDATATDASPQRLRLPIRTEADLPPLRNPAILIGQNDLTALSYLHEPDVLHNLEVRFCKRQTIYTYCGIVLVAINPYADLALYGAGVISAYRGHAMGELEPHIFAVAEEAYARLERERCNLSIIVSGESGAGKTVSAKYAMRYMAAVGGSESETQIEKRVLASSPIMEAIGNAKTTRNDNSSRFGKFTKLLFDAERRRAVAVAGMEASEEADGRGQGMSLTGGSMQTYLLEKSRVVFQAAGERNYHVFYQLCAARDEWPELQLDHQNHFRFLNQGNSPDIVRVSDRAAFTETETAFRTLGFTSIEVTEIIRLLASILHLGNIDFGPASATAGSKDHAEQEGCSVPSDNRHLQLFAEILQLDAAELQRWLTTRRIESIGDVVLIPMNAAEADGARNALAKHMYARLFQYVVNVINKSLAGSGGGGGGGGGGGSAEKAQCFIGVLDIYGFETFETNSFEQFCINYANEKLQQQFNQHVFKLEQEEYLREGIVWTMIDFYDNQPCIDMIEAKLGILDLLDEECRMPGGSDGSWVGKLIEKCAKYPHFDKPRYGTVSFFVRHFSDTVQYDSHGFLEKNRDTVSKELVNVLRASKLPLCQRLMQMEEPVEPKSSSTSLGGRVVVSASKTLLIPSKQHKQTVGSQFRDSLSSLIATLHSTTPHYVRCIKPNDDKHAFRWDPPKIVQQLRACGVLETIRISAAGFPSRWPYDNFYARYQLLAPLAAAAAATGADWDVKAACLQLVRTHIPDDDKYRFGNTQIFFRAGQVAYLEQVRSERRRAYIVRCQSLVRRFLCLRRYQRLRRTALGLQSRIRGLLARRRARVVRETRAAIRLQSAVRGWLQRRRYQRVRRTVCALQRYGRGRLARHRFAQQLDNVRATAVQRYCRGALARRAFRRRLHAIVVCQAAVRRFLARRLYRRLKAEARTISHMQQMYKGLENKIISLQQRIDEQTKEKAALQRQAAELPALRAKAEAGRTAETELRAMRAALAEREATLLAVRAELDAERDEKMAVLVERDREKGEQQELRRAAEAEAGGLRGQLAAMREEMARGERLQEQAAGAQGRNYVEVDASEVHAAYQRAVRDKEMIEVENVALRQELSRHVGRLAPPGHSRSVSNASSVNNDEDFGYGSAKNTLDGRRSAAAAANSLGGTGAALSNGKSNGLNVSAATEAAEMTEQRVNGMDSSSPDSFSKQIANSSTPKPSELVLMMKLRRICEEEREKRKSLESVLSRYKSSGSINTEDSLRASELEVENEKLRQEYSLLRNSIQRGVQSQELEAQYVALQEEHKRRRDECIQLRAFLAQQSQSLRSLGSLASTAAPLPDADGRFHADDGDLLEAYRAQKLVNRQLEAELTAVTEQSNARLAELSAQIDAVRADRARLEEIFQADGGDSDASSSAAANTTDDSVASDGGQQAPSSASRRQTELFLRHELQQSVAAYVAMNDQLIALQRTITELAKRNRILANRLRDNGLDSSVQTTEAEAELGSIRRMAQSSQGAFKYDSKQRPKIMQRLIVELTPRVAITLLPGLPAYIVFMCIRYTDLLNSDNDVRTLLTDFIQLVKKVYRQANTCELRVLWLVNCLKLHNLLKQYGGIPEYIKLNTEQQNQQQLKNFDLCEYRQKILDTICGLHDQIVRQVQDELKPFIVPAILDHDEISRGRVGIRHGKMTPSAGSGAAAAAVAAATTPLEPKSLVAHLERFYKQFEYFGLDGAYIEQICTQLMHHVCVIALNNLMLRQELCNWKTGMQIRYNVSCLEEWVRKKQMPNIVLRYLQPLIQVSLLLQSRKSEEDVDSIYELCSSLTTAQVLKILKSYTQDDCESAIHPVFLEKLEQRLSGRPAPTMAAGDFTMEEGRVQPFRVGYKYDAIRLEEIELPAILNLDEMLHKI